MKDKTLKEKYYLGSDEVIKNNMVEYEYTKRQ